MKISANGWAQSTCCKAYINAPDYRMLFNLYVFEGMKHREIATHLRISERTSKSNLSATKNILQNRINKSSQLHRLNYM